MACRFLCGFDDYDSTGALAEWYLSGQSAEYYPLVVSGLTGSCLEFDVYGHLGYADAKASVVVCPEGQATIFIGHRVIFDGFPGTVYPFLGVGDQTQEHVVVGIGPGGTFTAYRSANAARYLGVNNLTSLGNSATALYTNIPYYLEWEITIDDTVGVVKLYINGNPTPDLSLTAKDTRNAGTSLATYISFNIIGNAQRPFRIDDLYVNDTTGSKNTGLEGDVQVRSHMPNANGNSSQWDRSTGADQYATIDDNPQVTTDYNSTSVLNEVDTINIASLADAGATIKAVQVNILAKKSTSGTGGIVPVMRVDGVDYPHATTRYLSTEWVYVRQTYDQQADATDWNETDFNATEVGYKKTA